MPEADAEKVDFHPFDLTKVWSKKDYPLIEVGVMELNRNPANFFCRCGTIRVCTKQLGSRH